MDGAPSEPYAPGEPREAELVAAEQLRMVTSGALTEDLIHDRKVRTVLAGSDGRLVVPLRVTGDIHRPRVLPDSSLASAAAAAFGGSSLEEAASGLLDRLLKPRKKRGRK